MTAEQELLKQTLARFPIRSRVRIGNRPNAKRGHVTGIQIKDAGDGHLVALVSILTGNGKVDQYNTDALTLIGEDL